MNRSNLPMTTLATFVGLEPTMRNVEIEAVQLWNVFASRLA